jgi:hypothetical protein
MHTRRSLNQQSPDAPEIVYLVARCRLVLDAIEAAEPGFSGAAQIRAVTEEAATKHDVRGLRTIRRDLLDMSRGLPPSARRKLKARLDAQAADDPFGRAAS